MSANTFSPALPCEKLGRFYNHQSSCSNISNNPRLILLFIRVGNNISNGEKFVETFEMGNDLLNLPSNFIPFLQIKR